jgi:hypothetical protein
MLGRTLILKKEEGCFDEISADDIASLVCQEALKEYVPVAEIRRRAPEGARIAEAVCARLPQRPSMETIESAVRMSVWIK